MPRTTRRPIYHDKYLSILRLSSGTKRSLWTKTNNARLRRGAQAWHRTQKSLLLCAAGKIVKNCWGWRPYSMNLVCLNDGNFFIRSYSVCLFACNVQFTSIFPSSACRRRSIFEPFGLRPYGLLWLVVNFLLIWRLPLGSVCFDKHLALFLSFRLMLFKGSPR